MSELKVRIERLESMRVASAHGFGDSPEGLAAGKMMAWAKPKGIFDEPFQWFGFDNPTPSPGSPNYGYEVWVPVGQDIIADGDITIKDFPGGLYAVAHCPKLADIGKVWRGLVTWREESKYTAAYHQCLEKLLVPPDSSVDQLKFDLYLAIAE